MILRLILNAIQAYSGNSDAKLTGKQIALGGALTFIVLAILGLILPDSVRELFRLLRYIR